MSKEKEKVIDEIILIASTAKIGKNCTIQHGAVIEDGVTIGDNCFIGYYTIIRPDVVIGNNTEIRPHCFIAEAVKIGNKVKIFQFSNISKFSVLEDCVYVGARVLFTNTHKIAHLRKYKAHLEGAYISYGARIASGSILLPGIKVGKNALVGAGALIAHDVPEREIHFGIPAKKRGNVPEEECVTDPVKAKKKDKDEDSSSQD